MQIGTKKSLKTRIFFTLHVALHIKLFPRFASQVVAKIEV